MARLTLKPMVGLGGLMTLALLVAPGSMVEQVGGTSGELVQQYRGFVSPSQEVEMIAPLEEILAEMLVNEADLVEKGQVLARMDDRVQTVVVEAARIRAESEADLRRASLELEAANIDVARIQGAFDKNAATELEMIRAQIAASQAEAGHIAARENQALAQVNLKLEEARLSRYEVRAPFAGTVIDVIAEGGTMLTEQERMLVLADLFTLEARISLPVEMYHDVKIGKQYQLVADQPVNGPLPATLAFINPIIDTASQTFRCVFEIENPKAKLPAGFTVQLPWPQDTQASAN